MVSTENAQMYHKRGLSGLKHVNFERGGKIMKIESKELKGSGLPKATTGSRLARDVLLGGHYGVDSY